MNTRGPIDTSMPTSVLSVSFNNDASCFSVGLESGFCIFHTESCLLKAAKDLGAGISIVRMMGMTNYLALTGGGHMPKFATNKVILWDDSKSKPAMEITCLSPIRDVQLTRTHIVVILQTSIRVYAFARPPDLKHVFETADNYHGLCRLSDSQLVFPGRTPGQVNIVELATGNVSIIPAHASALRALTVSQDGELLATASETGTLIRVYSTVNCAKLAELRRGIDPATIFSLAFSPSGAMLACTSDKLTLHIFDVPQRTRRPTSSSSSKAAAAAGGDGKWGLLSKIPLMPRVFSDIYSFASTPFEAGNESIIGGIPYSDGALLGAPRPPKGVIGWIEEISLVVIGAGQDPRWEKFNIGTGGDGKRLVYREGWKRYLGNS